MTVDISRFLNAALLERATRFFTGELGWTQNDVPEVAAAVAANGYAILGGDVWTKREDGRWLPVGAGGTWDTKRLPSDSDSDYVARSLKAAVAYVSAQPATDTDERRYVLTCESPDFMSRVAGQPERVG